MKDKHDVQARMEKVRRKLRLDKLPKAVRVVVVSVLGGVVLAAGVIMIVTPGPAFVLIPLGLFLLASEFQWAQRWAQKLVDFFDKARARWRLWRRNRSAAAR
jgi:uncharacterized protein (TIGR02611 family)